MEKKIMTTKTYEDEEYTTKGVDKTREELAKLLLTYFSIIMFLSIMGILILIYFEKLQSNTAVTILLAISSVFSGLVASTITYYFSSK